MKTTDALSESLLQDRSDASRKRWAQYLIDHRIPLKQIRELIFTPHPVDLRFSWLVGYLCEIAPELVRPEIVFFFRNRQRIAVADYARCLAKQFYLCGVPESIEGEALDALFQWFSDPSSNISTRKFAMFAIRKLMERHPDLKPEFRSALERQAGKHTPNFNKRIAVMLESLDS